MKAISSFEINKLANNTGISIQEAHKLLKKERLLKAIDAAKDVEALAIVLKETIITLL